jgi:hypothetical protein
MAEIPLLPTLPWLAHLGIGKPAKIIVQHWSRRLLVLANRHLSLRSG